MFINFYKLDEAFNFYSVLKLYEEFNKYFKKGTFDIFKLSFGSGWNYVLDYPNDFKNQSSESEMKLRIIELEILMKLHLSD